MLRTSRKWKNAVRYQAVQAFSAEWKVYQGSQGVGFVPSGSTWDRLFLYNMAQGVAEDERLGAQVRIRRVDVWIHVKPTSGPHFEPETWCRFALFKCPNQTRHALSATISDHLEEGPSGNWSWARGFAPKKLSERMDPAYLTVAQKKTVVAGVGTFQRNANTYCDQSVPWNIARSSADQFFETRAQAYNITNAGYAELPGGAPQIPPHILAVPEHREHIPLKTDMLKRRDREQYVHLVYKPRGQGELVTFQDASASDFDYVNTLYLVANSDQDQATEYDVYWRVWYTDA